MRVRPFSFCAYIFAHDRYSCLICHESGIGVPSHTLGRLRSYPLNLMRATPT